MLGLILIHVNNRCPSLVTETTYAYSEASCNVYSIHYVLYNSSQGDHAKTANARETSPAGGYHDGNKLHHVYIYTVVPWDIQTVSLFLFCCGHVISYCSFLWLFTYILQVGDTGILLFLC